ncbi:MAG TPA: hypothetical protein VEU08_20710 [Vicinamibacterales bacterium]|nr:hypothetical protein [Vicinamibacterales bacterium]
MSVIAFAHPAAVVVDIGWILLVVAAVIGTAMIAIGMIEELPAIIRDTARRTRHKP